MKALMTLLAAGLICTSLARGDTPMDLTDGAACAFRVTTADRHGPWKQTVAEALKAGGVSRPQATWPGRWRTFVAWEPNETTRTTTKPALQKDVPTTLTLGGISGSRATLPLYTGGVLDLTIGHGAPGKGRWAWCFGAMQAERDEKITLIVETAGPVKVWIDGAKIVDADRGGEHVASVELGKGSHVVSARVHSGPGRWFLRGAVHPAAGRTTIQGRRAFRAKSPDELVSLTVSGPGCESAKLNGRPMPRPLEGLIYEQLPGVPPSLLGKDKNVLTWSLPLGRAMELAEAKGKQPGRLTVLGLRPKDVRLAMGPVVSPAGKGTLRIAIAADANVPASLTIDGRTIRSQAGVYHRFVVGNLKASTAYDYAVSVGEGETGRFTLRTPPEPGQDITVAIVGDPQSGKTWKDVAAAVATRKPDLVVIAGDLVVDGLLIEQWRKTFLSPGADLLSAVPVRIVPGNHDRYSPLLEQLFGDGKSSLRWTQQAGGAVLIGIDGGEDFSPDGEAGRWLDRTLKTRREKLAFVVSHYPAYSSRNHGKLADDGRVLEWTSRAARNHLVPILKRHGVTALFGGHDHGYERSELPGGLTAIVTGGAGAGTYPKRDDAEKQNPYSRAFAREHHISLLRITRDSATLQVVTPKGKQIDTRTWSARNAEEKNR